MAEPSDAASRQPRESADGASDERAELARFMRHQPLFEDLSEADLDRLLDMATARALTRGEILLREGGEGTEMFIIMSGEIEIFRGDEAAPRVVAVRGEGEVVGEMAPLGGTHRTASARALGPVRLLTIDDEALRTLFSCSPAAAVSMIRTVTTRLRSAEAMLVQQEKLAGLGTMAAGLAHELNNPAAAIARAAKQLGDAVGEGQRALGELARDGLDGEQVGALEGLLAATGKGGAPALSPLDAMDEEEALVSALEGAGVTEARSLSEALLTGGWRAPNVEAALAPFPASARTAVARSVAAAAETGELLRGTRAAADAISAIVGAVKSYTFMDQAPVQDVDVHEGLENTLVMLRHKLKDGVRVERAFAAELPPVAAHGSELNQVWTNLIDNAVDAMGGEGELRLRTLHEHGCVVVEVCDDGPGIPADVRPRVFDPFFTTKAVGSGTGLGLHIAYNIVRRHRGRIDVSSQPGRTCFRVELPAGTPG